MSGSSPYEFVKMVDQVGAGRTIRSRHDPLLSAAVMALTMLANAVNAERCVLARCPQSGGISALGQAPVTVAACALAAIDAWAE